MINFNVKGFSQFINKMKKAEWTLPVDAEKFMSVEAKKLIKEAKQASPYATFKKRWFTKTRRGTKASIWKGIFNKAPHLHLVNDGHDLIGHRPTKKHLGHVEGKHFIDPVIEHFETQFELDIEKFLKGVWD